MVQRHHQPGELIFAEEFYTFDPNVWEHEIAAAGRTVLMAMKTKLIMDYRLSPPTL